MAARVRAGCGGGGVAVDGDDLLVRFGIEDAEGEVTVVSVVTGDARRVGRDELEQRLAFGRPALRRVVDDHVFAVH